MRLLHWTLLFLICAQTLHGQWQTGGQLTLRGELATPEAPSWYANEGENKLEDFSGDLRLNTQYRNRSETFTLHYEIAAIGGERYEQDNRVQLNLPWTDRAGFPEQTQVLDLTRNLIDEPDHRVQHRIDRLSWRHTSEWGTLTVGRDIVTWGNGLVFNPVDLFSPFAPQDIERDYKAGNDLLLIDTFPNDWNGNINWQLLLIPRRDAGGSGMNRKSSSLALKAHVYHAGQEWDVVLGRHYRESILALGHVRYLGGAALRADLLCQFPEGSDPQISGVINLDYSWTWWDTNFYGLCEYYFQSLGEPDIQDAIHAQALMERLARGEVFTLGRHYLASSLRVELHPLVNFETTLITHLSDTSGLLQPRLAWDWRQDLQITLGARLYWGKRNSEFGGIPVPTTAYTYRLPDTAFLWVKWYF